MEAFDSQLCAKNIKIVSQPEILKRFLHKSETDRETEKKVEKVRRYFSRQKK